jgi:hypothetical protein
MNKNTEVIIERGQDATFTAYISSDNVPFGLLGDGKTVQEAIEDFYNSYEEMKEYYASEKKSFPNLEFEFKYDVASFLSYCRIGKIDRNKSGAIKPLCYRAPQTK